MINSSSLYTRAMEEQGAMKNGMTALRSEKTSTDLIILSMVKCCGTTVGSLSGRYKISVPATTIFGR